MTLIGSTLAAIFALLAMLPQASAQEAFNGKDLTVVDGEINLVGDEKFFLVYDRELSDFIFEAEIELPEGTANSGVMFRAHVEPNKVFGYQAECDGSDRRWSGGLYDEGRRGWIWPNKNESQAHLAKPEVQGALDRLDWNNYKIIAKGNKLK